MLSAESGSDNSNKQDFLNKIKLLKAKEAKEKSEKDTNQWNYNIDNYIFNETELKKMREDDFINFKTKSFIGFMIGVVFSLILGIFVIWLAGKFVDSRGTSDPSY